MNTEAECELRFYIQLLRSLLVEAGDHMPVRIIQPQTTMLSYYKCQTCGHYTRPNYKNPPKTRKCSCGGESVKVKDKPKGRGGSFGW